MRVVIDTNILFQALYSSIGASHEILRMIRDGDVELAISVPVFKEYSDVLLRPTTLSQISMDTNDIEAILRFIAYIGIPTPIHYLWRPNLKDEADNMFIELAVASVSKYLVTSNTKDYFIDNQLLFESFKVVTPREFLKIWREHHE